VSIVGTCGNDEIPLTTQTARQRCGNNGYLLSQSIFPLFSNKSDVAHLPARRNQRALLAERKAVPGGIDFRQQSTPYGLVVENEMRQKYRSLVTIEGNPTNEMKLAEAGLLSASNVVAALDSNVDNLLVVITCQCGNLRAGVGVYWGRGLVQLFGT
jgi:hypothetical protein